MVTFTPPQDPAYGLNKSNSPRVLQVQFGDGYSQRAEDGINNLPTTWDVTWDVLSVADADTIETFFNDRAGAESFDYQFPNESASAKYIVKTWNRTDISFDSVRITTQFEEVFDL